MHATGLAHDRFGEVVSISGNYAIIGVASADKGIISNTGAAVIYQYDGTDWVFMKKIYDPAGASFDSFCNSVSISGNYLLIGALYDDVGTLTNKGSAWHLSADWKYLATLTIHYRALWRYRRAELWSICRY